jgi:hypothetical protein
MVTCFRYEKDKIKIWDDFILTSKTPLFFFQRDFMEYHQDRFVDYSLMFYLENTLVAVLPASKHVDVLISHGGLTYGGLILSNRTRTETILNIIQELISFSKSQEFSKIIYKKIPYIFYQQPSDEDIYALFNYSGVTLYKKELSSAIRLDSRPGLSKGRKWLIARAKKNNLWVSVSKNWIGFYELLSNVLDKHDTKPVHTANELEYLSGKFPQNIELKVIIQEANIIAATVLFKFKNVVHTQYIAVSDTGKELGALDLLLETAIQEAQNNGFEYFSFGISTENNGKYLNKGLISQKESFGARGVVLDCYELSLN